MIKKELLVTIITVTYNSAHTVRNTIQSVISQDYPFIEYIIVDGASTDSTMQIIKEFNSKIAKIICEPDEGISDAFNKGISLASGELVGILNSDDTLIDGAISKLVEKYNQFAGVVYGDGIVISKDGIEKKYNSTNDIGKIKYDMPILHPASFVRRELYEKCGKFDTEFKAAMDRELFLRFYSGGIVFQHICVPIAVYKLGGFSEKNYIKYTLPENYRITVMYGGNKIKAFFRGFRNIVAIKISKIKKCYQRLIGVL